MIKKRTLLWIALVNIAVVVLAVFITIKLTKVEEKPDVSSYTYTIDSLRGELLRVNGELLRLPKVIAGPVITEYIKVQEESTVTDPDELLIETTKIGTTPPRLKLFEHENNDK